MTTLLVVVGGVIVTAMIVCSVLFVCACVASGRCAKQERERGVEA